MSDTVELAYLKSQYEEAKDAVNEALSNLWVAKQEVGAARDALEEARERRRALKEQIAGLSS